MHGTSHYRIGPRAVRVMENLQVYGNPLRALPLGPAGTEAYQRQREQDAPRDARRLDELAERVMMPVAYVAAILLALEVAGYLDDVGLTGTGTQALQEAQERMSR